MKIKPKKVSLKKWIAALCEAAGVFPDDLRRQGDGVLVRRSFFYQHGNTAEAWGQRVAQALEPDPRLTVVEAYEDWKPWPKDSYFVARVEERI